MPTDWRKGPPPCEGWWNASVSRCEDIRRHWNGKRWSAPVYVGDPDTHAERAKATAADMTVIGDHIEYRGLTAEEAAA